MDAAVEQKINEAVEIIRHYVPKFRVKKKSESWIFKIIGPIVSLFNRPFMKSFFTTLGYTAYLPSDVNKDNWWLIYHEGIHAMQAKKITRLFFALLYLAPFPIPFLSFWRVRFELEAYLFNMLMGSIRGDAVDKLWYVEQLSGPSYFWATTKGNALKQVNHFAEEVLDNRFKDMNMDYIRAAFQHARGMIVV